MNESCTTKNTTWAVLGATGFVGCALTEKLRELGYPVIAVRAPRLSSPERVNLAGQDVVEHYRETVEQVERDIRGATIVVNAAGLAEPDASDCDGLFGANSVLPVVVAQAAENVGSKRFIHLSSVAVQGGVAVLDSSARHFPFSPYSKSKALGEKALLEVAPSFKIDVILARATSVQGPGRPTTRRLQRLARSSLSSVASPGTQRSIVSSIDGLVAFILKLATDEEATQPIALQPWEGGTVSTVLQMAGDGKKPVVLPAILCRAFLGCAKFCSRFLGGWMGGTLRRLEVMWFGQAQESAVTADEVACAGSLRRVLSAHGAEGPE